MSRSVATVTWISHRNCGTLLQAYALQAVLKSKGYSCTIIDDSKVIKGFSKKKFSPVRILKKLFTCKSSYAPFDAFKHNYLDVDYNWETRQELSDKYDIYIAGSDQIWSPNVPFDDFYYLAFAKGRKISYAPSFGASVLTDEYIEKVRHLLSGFDRLTVREPEGVRMLADSFGLDASVTADPTILLDRCDWDQLMCEAGYDSSAPSEKYAFCYLLTENKAYLSYVKEYCRRHGLTLKIFCGGPLDLLDSVRKAEIVFTDSFHGSIFSLLYEKELLVFRRFSADSEINQNSRVEHLMTLVGLNDRITDYGHVSDKWNAVPIDYSKVTEVIKHFRNSSLDCLISMLEECDGEDLR